MFHSQDRNCTGQWKNLRKMRKQRRTRTDSYPGQQQCTEHRKCVRYEHRIHISYVSHRLGRCVFVWYVKWCLPTTHAHKHSTTNLHQDGWLADWLAGCLDGWMAWAMPMCYYTVYCTMYGDYVTWCVCTYVPTRIQRPSTDKCERAFLGESRAHTQRHQHTNPIFANQPANEPMQQHTHFRCAPKEQSWQDSKQHGMTIHGNVWRLVQDTESAVGSILSSWWIFLLVLIQNDLQLPFCDGKFDTTAILALYVTVSITLAFASFLYRTWISWQLTNSLHCYCLDSLLLFRFVWNVLIARNDEWV